MSEPTTEAGRALLFQSPYQTGMGESVLDHILAIEQQARRQALAEVRTSVEMLILYRYILPVHNDSTKTESHTPFDMVRRIQVLDALDKLEASE